MPELIRVAPPLAIRLGPKSERDITTLRTVFAQHGAPHSRADVIRVAIRLLADTIASNPDHALQILATMGVRANIINSNNKTTE
jgi:Arc/MetJ-type ribon-helix-helix transcriptional regulator